MTSLACEQVVHLISRMTPRDSSNGELAPRHVGVGCHRLAEPETFSKPVSGCWRSRSRFVASLAEPLPYLRRRSKCYPILNKPNFCMGPSPKMCGFLSVYAHSEIVHSRPWLFKRCIALAIHQINHFPADNYLGKQSHYPLEIYPPDSAINPLNNWGQVCLHGNSAGLG